MPKYKFQYLRVDIRQRGGGPTVCRIDVSHLNKKGVTSEWDRLDTEFKSPKYISCFESSQTELRCFQHSSNELTE